MQEKRSHCVSYTWRMSAVWGMMQCLLYLQEMVEMGETV